MALSSASKRSRICILIVVVATAFICAFIIYKGTFQKTILQQTSFPKSSVVHSEKLTECRSICDTEDCIYFANEIMKNMNPSSNPCENFYSFACGGFQEKHGKDTKYSTFDNQEDLMYVIIRDIIEKSSGPVGSPMEKLKTVYESCMSEESSDMKSAQTLLQFLGEIGIPKWPNLNLDFTFENHYLEEVLGTLYSYREAVFFTFGLPGHREFPETGIINLTIKQQYNIGDKMLNAEEMETVVCEILNHLDVEISNASQIVEDYVKVDTSIQKLHKENEENKKLNCSEGTSKCTFMDCTRESVNNESLVCNVLKSAVRSARAESALNTAGYELCCENSFYFESIVSLIGNYSHRALANYMALKVIMNNFEYMKFSLRRKLRSYFEMISYVYESERSFEMDKYKFCIQFLTRYMKYNLALMYVSRIFPGNSAEDVNEIVKDMKNVAADLISQQDWIEDNKKERISNEAREIRNDFYEEVITLNETELNRIYEMFEFKPRKDNFFRNVLESKKLFVSAVPEFHNYKLYVLPFDAGAYYDGSMTIGVALLLPPFYNYGMDKLFNYAVIAQALGHEIGHMIFEFLSTDNNHNETREHFEERKSCLIEQYSKFFIETIGQYVPVGRTISEDIPDDLTAKFLGKIVDNYLTNMTESFYLPGLPYSAEELFYVASSQPWCTVMTTKMEQLKYEQDVHGPPKFRVLGMLQNSERFSRVFNCEPNSFMNPEKKCSILDM